MSAYMADRRRLLELAREGIMRLPGIEAATALIELTEVTGRVLGGMTDEPVYVLLAIGHEEVEALKIFESTLKRDGT